MSDVGRLLPDGLLEACDAAGVQVPDEFLEAYEVLAEVVYYGARVPPDPGEQQPRGKRYRTGYFFGEPDLLDFKTAVDRRLAALRTALRAWTEAHAGRRTRRATPAPHGRSDLARARGARSRGADDPPEA